MKAYFASNNAQFVLPLATLPDPIQLTPTQVTYLLGENNIWSDTGDVYVTFGEEVKRALDGKQNEITASGILKGDGEGGVTAAVSGTDYQAPLTEPQTNYYGTCSTAAATQTKEVSITGITELATGLSIRVKFSNGQTYNGTPTLKVNSLTAKNIVRNGSTGAARYQWQAGEVLDLVYDGTSWVIVNNATATTTYYGLTRLNSATNSSSETEAATPKAVKDAYDLANGCQPKITANGVLQGDGDGNITAKTVDSEPVAGSDHLISSGAVQAAIPAGSDATPQMDGTGAAGSGTSWSRADHVHPTDTSRQAKITASGLLKGDGNGGVTAAVSGTDYADPASVATIGSDGLVTPSQLFSKIIPVSTSRDLVSTDLGAVLKATAEITLTIPTGLAEGAALEILNYSGGVVAIQAADSVTLNGTLALAISMSEQYKSVVLLHLGSNEWNAQGAIDV